GIKGSGASRDGSVGNTSKAGPDVPTRCLATKYAGEIHKPDGHHRRRANVKLQRRALRICPACRTGGAYGYGSSRHGDGSVFHLLFGLRNHRAGGSHFTEAGGLWLGGLLRAHSRLRGLGGLLGGRSRLGELSQKPFLLLQSLLHLFNLLLLKSHLLLEKGNLRVGAGF